MIEEAVLDFFSHIDNYNSINECWIWKTRKGGNNYGDFKGAGIRTKAHRWIWWYLHGPISPTKNLHHRCHVKRCVNPAHLELLSLGAHRMRHLDTWNFHAAKTHCKRGHEFNEENTYLYNGGRICKECVRLRKREWRAR